MGLKVRFAGNAYRKSFQGQPEGNFVKPHSQPRYIRSDDDPITVATVALVLLIVIGLLAA